MIRNRCSTHVPGRALFSLVAVTLFGPAAVFAQLCGENEPAFPVPECRNQLNGEEVACNAPNAVRLWPDGFRPGSPGEQLPAIRDTTQYTTFSIPGLQSGHELFVSLDIAGDYLYVAYNAGIQVWNIAGANAEKPFREFVRDGWNGQFLSYPPPGEQDGFTEDIAVIDPVGGNQDVLIAVAGRPNAGMSLWEHKLSTDTLTQLYQDTTNSSNRIAVAEINGQVYAVTGGTNGVFVYNVSQAKNLSSPCLDNAGLVCPTVYKGPLGAMDGGRYVDVIKRNFGGPGTSKLYVVASDGVGIASQPFPLEIWEIADPSFPDSAERKFSGLSSNTRGPEFFEHNGDFYLGVIELSGSSYVLKIFKVNHCLDNDGCGSLGTPVWSTPTGPVNATGHFLTYSESNGTPFLYYGFASALDTGSRIERLLDLTTLGTTNQLTEITAGGGTYHDACNGTTVDYWGDYYGGNDKGLRNFSPRIGMFNGPYFYRAAIGILDVHVRGSGGGGVPSITTSVVDAPPFYMHQPIDFSATAQNCSGTENWTWNDDDTETTVINSNGSAATITFDLCLGNDCPDRQVEVWALKEACSGAPNLTENRAAVTVREPRPQIRAIQVCPQSTPGCEQVPNPEFAICTALRFSSVVDGRAPFSYLWEIKDAVIGEVLAMGNQESFDWDTSGISLGPEVFFDGFESGDTSAWSTTASALGNSRFLEPQKVSRPDILELVSKGVGRAAFDVELRAANSSGSDQNILQVTLTGLGALGYGAPAITVSDLGAGSFDLQANSQSATEWRWEFEDPANGSSAGCQFYSSCTIYDWGQDDDQVTFQWTTPNVIGTYGVTVSIRNCVQTDPLSAEVSVDVTEIMDPEPLEMLSFSVDDPNCSLVLGFYECPVGEPIHFGATSQGGAQTYEFDWDADGTYDQQLPVSNPIFHSYPTTTTVRPVVRALNGAAMSDPLFLDHSIIVN